MPSAHAATSDTTDWLATLLSYWWLLLLFGGGIAEWVAETFNVGLSALYQRAELKHERRLEMRRLELEIAQARQSPVAEVLPAPKPGRCVHRRVKQVRDREDELVGWLCVTCDAQLPADWAVAREDL